MDSSQPLSIESFSYSWLINIKTPSFESLEDETSFIEMDPKMTPSKRFLGDAYDYNFDFPICQTPLALVHADELISNGFLMPIFIDPLKIEAYDVSDSIPSPLNDSQAPKNSLSGDEIHCSSMRRCRRLSRRMFRKYLNFLRPFYQRIRGRRSRAQDDDKRAQRAKKWVFSPQVSPRTSVAYSDFDCESSIYEAVLHCKRSIEK